MRKSFCFWDKCIWIGCIKLCILRREYLSLAVNVLKDSLRIFLVTRRHPFQLNYLHSDQWIWQSSCRWDGISILPDLLCCLSKRPLKRDFLDIYLTTYFGVRNFGNASAMKVSIFWKYSKFNLDLKNPPKNWEKAFCFWDNCIWICCVKVPLLTREYFSSAVYVLTNSFEIFHGTKRDPIQLNYLHSVQWIW